MNVRQPLEIVIKRINDFRKASSGDVDTFLECFEHVIRNSGWTKQDIIEVLRSLSA